MKKLLNPRLMLIASMTIFGTLGPFVRNIPVSSGELALYRALFAAVLIGTFLAVTKQKIPFRKIEKEIPLLLASGVAMGINWILLFEAYKYTTVSVATLSYYFAPVIVTVVCPFLFKEKLTVKQIICFVMSTVGLVMITGISDSGGESNLKGILFGLVLEPEPPWRSLTIYTKTTRLVRTWVDTLVGVLISVQPSIHPCQGTRHDQPG